MERDEKVKRSRKVRESITISWEINKKKIKNTRKNVENEWITWSLMWLNKSVARINDTLLLLYIYIYIDYILYSFGFHLFLLDLYLINMFSNQIVE